MSSHKRQRPSTSTAWAQYDHTKFISEGAEARFKSSIDRKTLMLEQGLKLDANLDGDMALMIVERNWFQLVEQPLPAVINIVIEFYANAMEHVNHVVMVRGKPVSFHADAINEYFGLETPTDGRYEDCLPDLDELIVRLCKPGTQWVTHTGIDEKISFPHSALSRYGKAWYVILCARLMPTHHQNDITKERARLLYGIVHHHYRMNNSVMFYKVDVDECIQESIDQLLRGSTTGVLLHEFLINDLCHKAGVQCHPSEPIQQPIAIIDHATIEKYKAWEGVRSHPRGEGYIMIRQPSPPVTAEPMQEQPPRGSRNQILWLAQCQDLLHQYNANAFNMLVDAFSRCNPNANLVVMHVPLILLAYPPSDDDEQ